MRRITYKILGVRENFLNKYLNEYQFFFDDRIKSIRTITAILIFYVKKLFVFNFFVFRLVDKISTSIF